MKTTVRRHLAAAHAALACLLFLVATAAGTRAAVDRDYVEDAEYTKTVAVAFNGTVATVTNGAGVTVTYGANSSYVAISSAVEGVEYVLSGTSADGYVQITSTFASKVRLNGLTLTSTNGPALSVLSAARSFVVLTEGTASTLADTATYTRTGSGTLYTSGPMILSGRGSLSLAGVKSHAVYGGAYVRLLGGDVTVTAAAKDGIHSKTFLQMDQGTLNLTATGDGIDGDSGYLVFNGGSVNVRSTVDNTNAITCDGACTVNGGLLNLTVNGAQSKGLKSGTDMAINGGVLTFNLAGAVVLNAATTTGGVAYTDPSYCAGIKCGGALLVAGGTTTITHTGLAGKAVSVNGNMTVSGGTLDLATSGGPSATYTNSAGASDFAAADGISVDGTLTFTGGNVTVLSTGGSGDGISSDLAMTINGGTFSVTGKGNRAKGLKSKTDLAIGGGTLNLAMTGASVLVATATSGRYDPDYCTGIKCGGNLAVSSGTLTLTHSGLAGKGISVDGTGTFTGGTLNLATSGNATALYTNAAGTTDVSAADCLKVDGLLTITAGTITATSTGTGGDAISGDGAAVIGTLGNNATPVITASTSGAHILVSGSGMNANYSNSKAFSVGGNLTFNGGQYKGTTTTDGGEGLESKANLVINGGVLEITSYDDAINAATSITINGGSLYCYASGNDGIDSNGTLKFTGGTVISSGAAAPEEGFDCDQNNFTIAPAVAGGLTMMGTGGATSTPTASTSTQRTVIYKGPATAGTILQIKNSGGTAIAVYKLPRAYSGTTGMTMVYSSSSLVAGTYTIVSGGTVSGGTEFHGFYTGATVSGTTTTLKTFTIATTAAAGAVTTVQ